MRKIETDILIIGGGIVGLTIARELIAKGADRILIIEKESTLGQHATGRNSGVLHAGVYYPAETLKAKFCLQGNLLMQQYCLEQGLGIKHCGKVIVARNDNEVSQIDLLYHRAKQNGADVEIIDERQLAEIEPNARTVGKALYSKNTAIVDSKEILNRLQHELIQTNKVTFLFNTQFKNQSEKNIVITNQSTIRFNKLINAAGAYADKVAHCFGIAKNYYLIPFKGIYRKMIAEKNDFVNGNIYPVPDLNNPFLGVHFTKNIYGDVYLGPTAIPAFGRENYGIFRGIEPEALRIIFHEMRMFASNKKFRTVALAEPKKYCAKFFFNDASKLVKTFKPEWMTQSPKVGIRPQLIDIKKKELMMDFLVIQDQEITHVLNAISPAFTSSMAFAKDLVQKL